MQTLILGKGFIGTHLAHFFHKKNIPYINVSQKELNYVDPDVLDRYLSEHRTNIKWVISAFGYTGIPNVDACEDNKELCYNYNVLYPLNVIKGCEKYGIPVIHVGSGCVYTGYEKRYTEDDKPNFGIFSDSSSYYSKCKHIFETIAINHNCYTFRIRIPFTSDTSAKNYFIKLLKYDTLINENNSITSITDFNEFVLKFINHNTVPFGIYNIVNPDPVKAEEIVSLLEKHNLKNPSWNFINIENLNTKANRSNCVLSTKKIDELHLSLPNTRNSLVRDIAILAHHLGK
jgi:3,5-epimerase/4-reductase